MTDMLDTRTFRGLVVCLAGFLVSCSNSGNELVVTPGPEIEDLFFDYKINGEEGRPDITCLFQYREDGPGGDAVQIPEPGKVLLDGEVLRSDSANFTGIYYEVGMPEESFTGMHTITVESPTGEVYSDTFYFRPLVLGIEFPEVFKRDQDIVLPLKGLDSVDYVRVVATDTSFRSADINRLDTVRDGKIVITKDRLWKLVNGPVVLLLTKERQFNLNHPTIGGGILTVNYSLHRVFELQE